MQMTNHSLVVSSSTIHSTSDAIVALDQTQLALNVATADCNNVFCSLVNEQAASGAARLLLVLSVPARAKTIGNTALKTEITAANIRESLRMSRTVPNTTNPSPCP